MKKLKCLSNFKTGYTFLAAIVLGFVFLLSVSGLPSMSSADDIYLELLTTGSDNWTQSGGSELFNFTINNTNASLSIKQINISMPLAADGNASFAVDMSTNGTSNASWNCYNITTDGVGNITLIECNTPTANITNGSIINIWFNATASSTSTEDVYQWNVTVLNETNSYVVSQNISSGIDGLAPRISDMGMNSTYFDSNDEILLWANVTDATFKNATILVVNASNVSEPCGGGTGMSCEPLGGFSRNCTAGGLWGGFEGNYTFNVTSYDNASHSNEATCSEWFFVDLIAPTVTLNYPVNGSWNDDGDIWFNFTPYDASLSLANCSLWIANSIGWEWHLNETNQTSVANNQENNITVYGFSTDANEQVQYIWNVRCWDQVANSSFASQNFTVNVGNRSNIIVESVTFDGPGGESPYANGPVTVNVTLLNNGTANVMNTTTVGIHFDDDSNPADSTTFNVTESVANTNLPYGGTYSLLYEFNVSSGDGVYYVIVEADYGTSNETEQNESDNSLTNSFSTFLNVTINNVTGTPNPGENVTVNVTVLYENGDPVSTLSSLDNFSIYDKWIALNRLRTETDPLPNTMLGDFGDSAKASGVYTFNYTVPGPQVYSDEIGNDDEEWYTATYAEYGLHDINVMATLTDDTGSTGNYTGNSSYETGSYNLTAPYLELDVSSFDATMTVGDYDTSDYTFFNRGNIPIPGGGVSVDSDDDGDVIISFEFVEPDNEDYDIEVELAPNENKDGGNETEGRVDAVAAGTENLTVTGTYTYDGESYSYVGILQVVVSAAGGDGGDDDDGGDTPAGGIQYDCITDSDCDSDEECDSDFMCVEIECDAGYYATGHTCKIKPVYEVEISEYESELSVLQGESIETVVYVNNTGNEDLTAMLTVEMELENVSFNVTPPSRGVGAGNTVNFTLIFNVSEGASAGKHTLSYKATTSSIAKDTKSFILSIQPLPEVIEEIKLSYQNYTAVVSQLLADFNAGKGQLSGSNLTAMETKINATETLFNSLKEAMENEDYAQAATYIDELSTLIGSSKSLMEELGISGMSGGFWNAVLLWIIVGVVCVGAVGLLIYMMVPSKGYALGKGYAPQGGGITNKLKNALQSIKEKTSTSKPSTAGQIVQKYKPAYSSGYNKLSGSYKSQPGGLADKMRKTFKKEK